MSIVFTILVPFWSLLIVCVSLVSICTSLKYSNFFFESVLPVDIVSVSLPVLVFVTYCNGLRSGLAHVPATLYPAGCDDTKSGQARPTCLIFGTIHIFAPAMQWKAVTTVNLLNRSCTHPPQTSNTNAWLIQYFDITLMPGTLDWHKGCGDCSSSEPHFSRESLVLHSYVNWFFAEVHISECCV